MITLAVVASEKRKLKGSTGCSLFSQQRTVKGADTDELSKVKQEEKYEVRGTVQIRAKKTTDRRGPEESKMK
jgi:hypothetical protein